MHVYIRPHGMVITNCFEGNDTNTIIDALSEKCEIVELQGHILINFPQGSNWKIVDWIKETLEKVCPEALEKLRFRLQFSFALSGGEGLSNPIIRSMDHEFTVHAFGADNQVGKYGKFATSISVENLIRRREDGKPCEDINIGTADKEEIVSFYNPMYTRSTGYFASTRLLKRHEDKTSGVFLVEFTMVRMWVNSLYFSVTRQCYMREFTISQDPKEPIGILNHIGKTVNGAYGEPFENLVRDLDYAARKMYYATKDAGLEPAQNDLQNQNVKLANIIIAHPDMVKIFTPIGYTPSVSQAMQSQFPNVSHSAPPQGMRFGNPGQPRKPPKIRLPFAGEYDIIPNGIDEDKVITEQFRVKIPSDQQTMATKYIALSYAAFKSGNGPMIEELAKEIEMSLRKHPDLLVTVPQVKPEKKEQKEKSPSQQKITHEARVKTPYLGPAAQKLSPGADPMAIMQQQFAEQQSNTPEPPNDPQPEIEAVQPPPPPQAEPFQGQVRQHVSQTDLGSPPSAPTIPPQPETHEQEEEEDVTFQDEENFTS